MFHALLLAALSQAPLPDPDAFPTPPPLVASDDDDDGAPPDEAGDAREATAAPEAPAPVTVDAFEAPLAGYGTWTTVEGVRAWQPAPAVVGADFVPYGTGGQWVSTRAGWAFESSYPFGWATYHYGRWWMQPGLGWVWIPDTVWGPSWVEWRMGGGYTGWAPLPPLGLARWHRPRWFFVESPYFCGGELYRHRLAPGYLSVAFSVTAPLAPRMYRSGVSWHRGPAWNEVVRYAPQAPVRRPVAAFFPPRAVAPPPTAWAPPVHAAPPAAVHTTFAPPPRAAEVRPPPPMHMAPPPAAAYVRPSPPAMRAPATFHPPAPAAVHQAAPGRGENHRR